MNVEPTVPTATLGVLVTLRSALVSRLMVLVAVLLVVLLSGVVLVMPTALVMEPAPALTDTVSVSVPPAALANVPSVRVTAPVEVWSVPDDACALTSVKPAAVRLSVMVTLLALLGPVLEKVIT